MFQIGIATVALPSSVVAGAGNVAYRAGSYMYTHPVETISAIETLDGYYGGSSPGANWGSFASGFENFTGINIIPNWLK